MPSIVLGQILAFVPLNAEMDLLQAMKLVMTIILLPIPMVAPQFAKLSRATHASMNRVSAHDAVIPFETGQKGAMMGIL